MRLGKRVDGDIQLGETVHWQRNRLFDNNVAWFADKYLIFDNAIITATEIDVTGDENFFEKTCLAIGSDGGPNQTIFIYISSID